jgi:hypothetical protein
VSSEVEENKAIVHRFKEALTRGDPETIRGCSPPTSSVTGRFRVTKTLAQRATYGLSRKLCLYLLPRPRSKARRKVAIVRRPWKTKERGPPKKRASCCLELAFRKREAPSPVHAR